ncbi:MAG TPA: hypothetical protein VGF34_12800 [Stellaceae bacterium]|jgi:hypothetical protein
MNMAFTILAAAAFSVVSVSTAWAQGSLPAEAPGRATAPRGTALLGSRPVLPETDAGLACCAGLSHVLLSTILLQDSPNPNLKLPKGKTTYNFTSVVFITCPVAVCTLEIEAMVQAGQNKTAGNLWYICADIDDKSISPTCPYQGTLPTNGSFVAGHYAWSTSLKKGMHTVSPNAFVTAPAGLASYHLAYRLYKP